MHALRYVKCNMEKHKNHALLISLYTSIVGITNRFLHVTQLLSFDEGGWKKVKIFLKRWLNGDIPWYKQEITLNLTNKGLQSWIDFTVYIHTNLQTLVAFCWVSQTALATMPAWITCNRWTEICLFHLCTWVWWVGQHIMLTVCNNSLMKPKNPNSWNKAPFPNHLLQVLSSVFRSVLHIVGKAALNKQNIELIRHHAINVQKGQNDGRMNKQNLDFLFASSQTKRGICLGFQSCSRLLCYC